MIEALSLLWDTSKPAETLEGLPVPPNLPLRPSMPEFGPSTPLRFNPARCPSPQRPRAAAPLCVGSWEGGGGVRRRRKQSHTRLTFNAYRRQDQNSVVPHFPLTNSDFSASRIVELLEH